MQFLNRLFDIEKNQKKYLLVGCPNVGKSSIFNRITWKNSPVANYDHLTTNFYEGNLKRNATIQIVDLPGVYSLNPTADDEKQTFDYIFNKDYDGVINICGALTLERDLFLTIELLEAGILDYLIINMVDELDEKTNVNIIKLTSIIKVPVLLTSIKQKANISQILNIINATNFESKKIVIKYNEKIEKIIDEVSSLIDIKNCKLSKRFLITQAIIGNQAIITFLKNNGVYDNLLKVIHKYALTDCEINDINYQKYLLIKKVISSSIKTNHLKNEILIKKTSKVDKFFLNPWFAIPFFIFLMVLIYFVTFYEYAGGYLQKLLADDALGLLQTKIYDAIYGISSTPSQEWWAMFVSDGLLGGIFTIISFIPWIVILMFLISILEQVGLLSRISIVFDNLFSKFGLSGRSIVSLITSVGCNIPAILLAKNSNSIKEKLISIFIIPFVSCSARIVVFGYLGIAIFGNDFSWALNVIMTFISIVIALFIGYCFSNIWFRKTNTIFLSELLPYRNIDLLIIFKKILLEVFSFVKRTILIVGLMNLIIWIFMYTSPSTIYLIDPFDLNNKSFLWYLSYPFKFILHPLGIGYDWRLCVSLLTALPAKEIVASNIDLLFGNVNSFIDQISQTSQLVIPIILSYLCFISFYIPCLATISIMKKEIGLKYTLIHIVFSLVFTYLFCFSIFTISASIQLINNNNLNQNYLKMLFFIIGMFMLICIFIKCFKYYLIKANYLITNKLSLTLNVIFYGFVILSSGSLIGMNVLVLI